MLKKFLIERNVPGVGAMGDHDLGKAAMTSNAALAQLRGVLWQQSYVTADKTFCVYMAESEDLIREHARLSGFPANRIIEITTVFDPSTEQRGPTPAAQLA